MLITQLKIATATLLTVLTLALTIACGSDEPTPQQESLRGTDQDAAATITALDAQIAELQKTNEEREMNEKARMAQTLQAPTPTPFMFPTSAPTPIPAPTPTPGPPGICDRSPQIQEILLKTLDNTLCQEITHHELFRITALPAITMPRAQPGDFHGLTNLTQLRLTLSDQDLNRQLLTGLDSVHQAVIQSTGFTPDALGELPGLRTLDLILIDNPRYDPTDSAGQSLPDLDLTQLTRLRIGNLIELHSRTLRPQVLKGLPNLKELSLIVSPKAYETQRLASFTIRPDLLDANPDLSSIEIRQGSGQHMKTTIFEDSFTGNPNLKSITLYTHETDTHIDALARP